MSDLLSGSIHKDRLSLGSSSSPKHPDSPYSDSPLLQQLAQAEEVPRPSFRRSLSTNDSFTPASSRVIKVNRCEICEVYNQKCGDLLEALSLMCISVLGSDLTF